MARSRVTGSVSGKRQDLTLTALMMNLLPLLMTDHLDLDDRKGRVGLARHHLGGGLASARPLSD